MKVGQILCRPRDASREEWLFFRSRRMRCGVRGSTWPSGPSRPVPGVAEEFVVQKGGGSSRSQIEHVLSGRRYICTIYLAAALNLDGKHVSTCAPGP